MESGLAGALMQAACFGSWIPPAPPPPLFLHRMAHSPSKDSPGPTQAKHTNILHYASHLQTCITIQGRRPGISEQE